MAKKNRKLLEILWQEFLQKIRRDWQVKYGRSGELESYKDISKKMELCEQISNDIKSCLASTRFNASNVVSSHTLNRILNAEYISPESDEMTLEMFALYLGYKSWGDFERKTSLREDVILPRPEMNTLNQFTSENALNQLAQRLMMASKVLNTRIAGASLGQSYYNKRSEIWIQSVEEYLKIEGKYFKDILSDVMLDQSTRLLEYEGYSAFHLPHVLPSFLNFIVLEFDNQQSEVWLGWVISEYNGLEQPCYRSQDPVLVKMFKDWFYDLLRACVPVQRQLSPA